MAKCRICGKHGLFLKLNYNGVCSDCNAIDVRRQELEALKKEALNAELQISEFKNQINDLEAQKAHAESEAAIARQILSEARSDVEIAKGGAAKYRSFAKSIKEAMRAIHDDAAWSSDLITKLQQTELEDFLPEPDLQCLTVKDLASKYRKIRKDIITLCESYEARYTTKANASIYRLMVLALQAEFENILYTLQLGKLEAGENAVHELVLKYYSIATDGNQSIAPSIKRFIVQLETMYLEAIHVEYEYYVQRERAKEEQRAIKEQMRQEAEERKRLETERKKVEAEESKYQQEIQRITDQMQSAHDAELAALRKRLEEVTALVAQVQEKKEEIINLQNGKAGTVYIISNIGSFGDHVFKVGMTRRLEPQDRVNELGDASVPFPFDVHSFIFSEDAVALETALHRELDSRRVNKVNLRKEFFNVSIDELKAIVERIDPTAPFRVTALAEQYRQSLSIKNN